MTATSRAVDQLVTEGLLDRREDPHDRRVRLISLSATGRALSTKHLDARRDALRNFVGRLPLADRDRLSAALRPILLGNYLPPHIQETAI